MTLVVLWLAGLFCLDLGSAHATTFLQLQSTYLGGGWFQYQMSVQNDPFFREADITGFGIDFTNQIDQGTLPTGWEEGLAGGANWETTNSYLSRPYELTFLVRSLDTNYRLGLVTNHIGATVFFSLYCSDLMPGMASGDISVNVAGYHGMRCLVPCSPDQADGSPTNFVYDLKLEPDITIDQLLQTNGEIYGVGVEWTNLSTLILQGSQDLKDWKNIAYIYSGPPETLWRTNQPLNSYGNFFRVALVADGHSTNLPPISPQALPTPRAVASAAALPATPRVTGCEVVQHQVRVNLATQSGQMVLVQAMSQQGKTLQSREVVATNDSAFVSFDWSSLPTSAYFKASILPVPVFSSVLRADPAPPSGLAEGLDGYWTFDETNGGILHDSSGHGFDGALVNYPGGEGNWTSGQVGGALLFAGPAAGQSVKVPDFAMPTHSMTLTAWVWASSLPRWATVAANWNEGWGAFNYATFGATPNMSLYAADANTAGINIDYGVSSASLSLGQWHFVAFVADSKTGTVAFLQDGAVAGSFHYHGQLLASSSTLNLGDDPSDTNPSQGNWDGKLDDLAVWTRALSLRELTTIYQAGLAGHSLQTLMTPSVSCPETQAVECGTPANVTAQVSEPDGAALTVVWTVNGMMVQTNEIPAGDPPLTTNLTFSAELPLGTNVIEVAAANSLTNTASCATKVIVADTNPPVIHQVNATPNKLWPPNHKMVVVAISAVATDNCGSPNWKVVSVSSNEPANGLGDGNTLSDWKIIGKHAVALRAERSGTGSGRIYTVTVQARDAAGNLSSPSTVTITVPKSMGKNH